MQNKLANTKSYLDRQFFFKNAIDSVEEKRKKKRQKDKRHRIKGKKLRMDDNRKEFCKLLLVVVMRNKVIYP